MKKGVTIFALLFVISAIIFAGALASGLSETESVQKAYKCFNGEITNKTCSKLGTEEKIFALLTSGKCKTELLNVSKKDSNNNTCWSKNSNAECNLEITSKAALALNSVGANTDKPTDWILSKKGISSDLNWYLELDGNGPLTCNIGYENSAPGSNSGYQEYSFNIDGDKKIDQGAGSCLTLVNGDYWFKISNTCYEKEFQISCNESFISTLLYREGDSSTYHVSPDVHSSSGGTTIEKIDSYCLLNGASCDYLGTLWSSTVLNILDKNFTEFLPYLTTTASKFSKTFPESFLYLLTGSVEYRTKILQKQVLNKYWSIIGGRGQYYDTALALLPFQPENLQEKQNSKNWLLEVQGPEGCWNNKDIVSTGFLLYSLWSRNNGGGNGGDDVFCTDFQTQGYECINSSATCSGDPYPQYTCGENQICCNPNGGGDEETCISSGFDCVSSSQCDFGSSEDQYTASCPGITICCSSPTTQPTCSDQGGIVCNSNQECKFGNELNTNDLTYGEICCTGGGTCETKQVTNIYTCENNLGICQSSCSSGYEKTSVYTCETSSDVCCITSNIPSKSYWWIWVLFFLVILVVVGIIYRDKLKEMIDQMKAKKGRGSGSPQSNGRGMPPRFPPSYPREAQFRPSPPRRIVPESRPQRVIPKHKSPKELDEVLKKLKEIGK